MIKPSKELRKQLEDSQWWAIDHPCRFAFEVIPAPLIRTGRHLIKITINNGYE